MGAFVDGTWREGDFPHDTTGRFVRPDSPFRNWITASGEAGPSGVGGFKAEPGRYHLVISLACPWAHRTAVFRKLKGLEDVISMTEVEPVMGEQGWKFGPDADEDTVNGKEHLNQVYLLVDPRYTGRVSVPLLWDKERRTIVSNESPEIIRMLNSAFDAFTNNRTDYYPAELRGEIDALNALVFNNVNNGVYRCGFASTQEAYEEAFLDLFGTLDQIEERLSRQRYLAGDRFTEADWRLFTTILRFDAVYYSHFKCNLRRIADYPNLSNYVRELYQMPGVAETVSIDHIKRHYYGSQRKVNPTGIVPLGPELHFGAPHDRNRFVS